MGFFWWTPHRGRKSKNAKGGIKGAMNNSNLEFRKIPSLDFLYEVNSNGTILRNVKSKKQSKIVLDMHHANNGIG